MAHDLIYGPPPPPRSQVVAAFLGRLPFNILALVFAGLVGLFYVRIRRKPPISTAGDGVHLDPLAAPDELAPALVGALLNGRTSDAQIEATILDFARRGMLVMEPVSKSVVQMRLLGDGKDLTGYEKTVWNGLDAAADNELHTLTNDDLAEVRKGWSWPKTQLQRDLIERGWYDPAAASARRATALYRGRHWGGRSGYRSCAHRRLAGSLGADWPGNLPGCQRHRVHLGLLRAQHDGRGRDCGGFVAWLSRQRRG